MSKVTRLHEICLAAGVAAMTPNPKDTIAACYMRAKDTFYNSMKHGRCEMDSFMDAMFSAAKPARAIRPNLQDYAAAMIVVRATFAKLKRHKCIASAINH